MQDTHHLWLADWRRSISELYARVRREKDPRRAWLDYRRTRDGLFKRHTQSPLNAEQQEDFESLQYLPYATELRLMGRITPVPKPQAYSVDLPAEGLLRYRQIATIQFELPAAPVELMLYWIEGYGGGLFLPFRDATNGRDTYSGGRYLYDSIKGADLGAGTKTILLDFNFAYNPSCAYNDRWICPLAPAENWLPWKIGAGEMAYL